MNILKLARWLPVAHTIAESIDEANKDHKVTYAEAVDIAADAAHAVLERMGIADHAAFVDDDAKAG